MFQLKLKEEEYRKKQGVVVKEVEVEKVKEMDWRSDMTLWQRARLLALKRAQRGKVNWTKVVMTKTEGYSIIAGKRATNFQWQEEY